MKTTLGIGFSGRLFPFVALSGLFVTNVGCGGSGINLFGEETTPADGQCADANDCPGDQGCVQGQCADPCQSDKECKAAGLRCDTGIGYCSPNPTSSGSTGVGGSAGAGGGHGGSNGAGGGSRNSGGAAGSGGRGGSAGAGGSARDGGGSPALLVEYLCNVTVVSTTALDYHVRITNNGAAALPLDGLSVRYYFTYDVVDGSFVVDLAYGDVSAPFRILGSQVSSTCSAYGPKATANSVCQTTVSGLDPMAPGSSLLLQLRIHTQQFQALNQANDYSFDPGKTAFAPYNRVTVHRGGMLLAGTAP